VAPRTADGRSICTRSVLAKARTVRDCLSTGDRDGTNPHAPAPLLTIDRHDTTANNETLALLPGGSNVTGGRLTQKRQNRTSEWESETKQNSRRVGERKSRLINQRLKPDTYLNNI
jgi:hypothetical protein